jgi:hypothetical protein
MSEIDVVLKLGEANRVRDYGLAMLPEVAVEPGDMTRGEVLEWASRLYREVGYHGEARACLQRKRD